MSTWRNPTLKVSMYTAEKAPLPLTDLAVYWCAVAMSLVMCNSQFHYYSLSYLSAYSHIESCVLFRVQNLTTREVVVQKRCDP